MEIFEFLIYKKGVKMITKDWEVKMCGIRIYVSISRNCNKWICSLTIEKIRGRGDEDVRNF